MVKKAVPTSLQTQLFEEILHERKIQTIRFGHQSYNDILYVSVVNKVLGKLTSSLLNGDRLKKRGKFLQLAAVAMAALESMEDEDQEEEDEDREDAAKSSVSNVFELATRQ